MSYASNQELKYQSKSLVEVICDNCNQSYFCTYKSAEKNRKKNACHKCMTCSGFKPRPQNSQSYWTDEIKKQHSNSMVASEAYKQAIEQRDNTGPNNPMFGKKMSVETKKKMSLSRTGKIGESATAWKGGKSSIVKRVKGIIHGRYDWYGKVFQRDGWKCVQCGSTMKLDAHHIDPVNQIIKRLCDGKTFLNDDEKVAWLVEQPELADLELKNGKTLCRICHRKLHENWGSHECR